MCLCDISKDYQKINIISDIDLITEYVFKTAISKIKFTDSNIMYDSGLNKFKDNINVEIDRTFEYLNTPECSNVYAYIVNFAMVAHKIVELIRPVCLFRPQYNRNYGINYEDCSKYWNKMWDYFMKIYKYNKTPYLDYDGIEELCKFCPYEINIPKYDIFMHKNHLFVKDYKYNANRFLKYINKVQRILTNNMILSMKKYIRWILYTHQSFNYNQNIIYIFHLHDRYLNIYEKKENTKYKNKIIVTDMCNEEYCYNLHNIIKISGVFADANKYTIENLLEDCRKEYCGAAVYYNNQFVTDYRIYKSYYENLD